MFSVRSFDFYLNLSHHTVEEVLVSGKLVWSRLVFWYEENLVSGGLCIRRIWNWGTLEWGGFGMSWIWYEEFGMSMFWYNENLEWKEFEIRRFRYEEVLVWGEFEMRRIRYLQGGFGVRRIWQRIIWYEEVLVWWLFLGCLITDSLNSLTCYVPTKCMHYRTKIRIL